MANVREECKEYHENASKTLLARMTDSSSTIVMPFRKDIVCGEVTLSGMEPTRR
jgi:hypothetical protein